MNIQRLSDDDYFLSSFSYAKLTTMGNVVEVVAMKKFPAASPIRKLNKDLYCDVRTGEVFEYSHGENRADNLKSVRRTLSTVRAVINCNVTVPQNCRWLTFTYRENMTDTRRLYKDWDSFRRKFNRWCLQNDIDKPEYIAVVEPQGRGAWHLHVFFIWNHPAPFLDNNGVIARLWGQGFTRTKAVSNCDNVGAYFSAYLADMPFDEYMKLDDEEMSENVFVEVKSVTDEDGKRRTKKIVKGGRLKMYPPGMNILRCSKGIKRPIVEKMTYGKAQKKVCGYTQTFRVGFDLQSEDGSSVNQIFKEYYNKVRKTMQE